MFGDRAARGRVPAADVSSRQAAVLYAAYMRGDLAASEEEMRLVYSGYVRAEGRPPSASTDTTAVAMADALRSAVDALARGDAEAANARFRSFAAAHRARYGDPLPAPPAENGGVTPGQRTVSP